MLTTSLTLLDRMLRNREPAAWERFVQLYAPLLASWIERQGFQPADTADLTQEVLLKLLRELPKFEKQPGGSFRGWLYRICSRACADFRRRTCRNPATDCTDITLVHAPDQFVELEESEYARRLIRRAIDLVREDFTPVTWAAFHAVAIDNEPIHSVARSLQLSPNAVYLARFRVMARLRQELDGLME